MEKGIIPFLIFIKSNLKCLAWLSYNFKKSKLNLKRYLCLYSYILALVFSNFLQIPASIALSSNKKTDTKEISTDFLNKLPNSFYILGAGDALRINISS